MLSLCGILFLALLTGGTIQAQSDSLATASPGSFGGVTFKRLFMDYQTLHNGDFGAFREYTDGLEFSYLLPLSERFFLDIPVKIGLSNNREVANNNLIGADVHANYYLRDWSKILRPYLLAGVGAVIENMDSVDVQVPLGGGIDIRMADNAYLTWQSELRLSSDENKHNLHHSIGFKYFFGSKKDMPPPVPADRDMDGIVDSLDRCPDVPGLAAFDGCPDTDNDGIQDSEDRCPEYPGLRNLQGCPDTDGDGVADTDDECPNEPGPAANNGCPVRDRDGDGIPDDNDDCPDEAGLAALNGCPDRDDDGIADKDDDCPDDAGLRRFGGCPDSDGDGVRDPDDACPSTAGPASNNGCPVIEAEDQETLEFAMQAVQFEHGSARLTRASYAILDDIVDILNKYNEYRLEISGHTDDTGAADFNQRLSERRAKACFDYLVSRNISVRRLSYVGFGEERPIADNTSRSGRQLNRRVEFNMIPGLN